MGRTLAFAVWQGLNPGSDLAHELDLVRSEISIRFIIPYFLMLIVSLRELPCPTCFAHFTNLTKSVQLQRNQALTPPLDGFEFLYIFCSLYSGHHETNENHDPELNNRIDHNM